MNLDRGAKIITQDTANSQKLSTGKWVRWGNLNHHTGGAKIITAPWDIAARGTQLLSKDSSSARIDNNPTVNLVGTESGVYNGNLP
jgi:hypothetical protein